MFGYDWPRLHAALNDLPAALLVTAVFFDLLAALTRREALRRAGFWTMVAGAGGGILAVLSGLAAEDEIAHGEAVHQVMETHETLAFVTLAIFAVVALWRILREVKMGPSERMLALGLSLGGAGVLVATGVYGGKLVFEHAAGISTEVMQAEMQQRAEGAHEHEGEGSAGADSASAAAPAGGHTHAPGTPPHRD